MHRFIRRVFTGIALIALAPAAIFAAAQGEYESNARFPVPSDRPVWIESELADVAITGGSRPRVETSLTASPRIVEQIEPVVVASEDADGLHLKIVAGRRGAGGGPTQLSRGPDDYLRLTVMVPAGAHVVVALSEGAVRARSYSGRLTLATARGDIELERVTGVIAATTITGTISATHISLTGQSRLSSSTGDIDIQIDRGADLLTEADSGSGRVTIR